MAVLEGAGLAAGAALLAWRWRRDQTALRSERGRFLDACRDLVEGGRVEQDGADYPTLRGAREGLPVELRATADGMGLRKLPALWLSATVAAPTGAPGVLDVLLRASGAEHWSPSDRLPVALPTPRDLPETALVRADRAGAALLPLAPRGFLAWRAAKEALVTPRGVRLVALAGEAAWGPYLVLRQASFRAEPLEPAAARDLLDEALRLHAAVRARFAPPAALAAA